MLLLFLSAMLLLRMMSVYQADNRDDILECHHDVYTGLKIVFKHVPLELQKLS